MSSDTESPSPGRLKKLAQAAKLVGKSAVIPAIQQILREQVITIFTEHDPEELERYIDVHYDLVENELADEYEEVFRKVGPQFTNEIQSVLTPDNVHQWLLRPDEWMDVEQHPHKATDVRECGRIIRDHPQGRRWLESQILYIYEITGVMDAQ